MDGGPWLGVIGMERDRIDSTAINRSNRLEFTTTAPHTHPSTHPLPNQPTRQQDQVSVTLVEASDHILGAFDRRLVDYVSNLFSQRRIRVLTGTSVVKVEENVAYLKVWSWVDLLVG
jgi:NADH dehydrogenase FAD-containing subunit